MGQVGAEIPEEQRMSWGRARLAGMGKGGSEQVPQPKWRTLAIGDAGAAGTELWTLLYGGLVSTKRIGVDRLRVLMF
jgi:hypothetical protein